MRGRGSGGAVLGQAGFCQGKHEAQEDDAFHAGKFNREGATAQRILGVGRILATDETRNKHGSKNLQKVTKGTKVRAGLAIIVCRTGRVIKPQPLQSLATDGMLPLSRFRTLPILTPLMSAT